MREKFFLAEDEPTIRETIKTFLESEGYEVKDFPNGNLLFEAFQTETCDLVILDIMMPGLNGFEITKKIRAVSSVSIIILTAKDSDMDYATGINVSSDDYFTKPFSAVALTMRVRAILRRVQMDQQISPSAEVLHFADIEVQPKTMSVTQNRKPVSLTPSEYRLFVYLLENQDRAVSREELLDKIWGYENDIETRACDDTVRRLRKKILSSRAKIETVWGYGFTLKEAQ